MEKSASLNPRAFKMTSDLLYVIGAPIKKIDSHSSNKKKHSFWLGGSWSRRGGCRRRKEFAIAYQPMWKFTARLEISSCTLRILYSYIYRFVHFCNPLNNFSTPWMVQPLNGSTPSMVLPLEWFNPLNCFYPWMVQPLEWLNPLNGSTPWTIQLLNGLILLMIQILDLY